MIEDQQKWDRILENEDGSRHIKTYELDIFVFGDKGSDSKDKHPGSQFSRLGKVNLDRQAWSTQYEQFFGFRVPDW